MLPAEFIDDTGFGITEAAERHLRPLIAGEQPPPMPGGKNAPLRIVDRSGQEPPPIAA